MIYEAHRSLATAQLTNHHQVRRLVKRSPQAGSDQGVLVDQHHTHKPTTPFRRRALRAATAPTAANSRALPVQWWRSVVATGGGFDLAPDMPAKRRFEA